METFCIEKNGAYVRYVSDVPLSGYYSRNKNFMEFYGARIVPDDEDLINYTVEYHNTEDNMGISFQNNTLIVNYPFERLNESIIIYLGYHLLEKQFGEMGLCSCHSACVSKNGEATLILGDAGAGKTSLAMNLCAKHGFSLISNDRTLIGVDDSGVLQAFGGTKFVNLRRLSVRENMPFLLYLFKNEITDEWTNKISIMASDLGYDEEYGTIPITQIVFVHVDSRNQTLKVSNGDSWRNNFLLYQNLSDHIRGSSATFIDKSGHPIGYIPPFESENAYNKRKAIIDHINESPNYHYVNGSLNDVVDFINKFYNNLDKGMIRERKNGE